jgi:putative ABC transport system ATP-binding protein
MEPIIVTDNLSRDFQAGGEIVHALKNVSISIMPKTLTILKGRSGSGKTTLINLLGAMDFPSQGSIFLNNKKINKMSVNERDRLRREEIGFVFQSGALISNMTAFENIEFSLRIAGYNLKDRKRSAEECLNLVGLGKRMHHFPLELSGGEQQRVGIARSIAHNPKVVFADEPTSALDTTMGLQVVKTFRQLVENQGLTVIMTTHDPNMIEVADSVYTLQDGEIINE